MTVAAIAVIGVEVGLIGKSRPGQHDKEIIDTCKPRFKSEQKNSYQ